MKDQIFVINGDNLTELNESEFGDENSFQALLEKYPRLLSGKQINSDEPRKWLLITREAGIPGEKEGRNTWSVDHLFIDQDGIPTLVEVKRSTDIRIRREVVGQMLDYASNAVAYWSVESIQNDFQTYCNKHNVDPSDRLNEFLDFKQDEEHFWNQVETNLQAGKIRMLFVADRLPRELVRIIEFMNEQMSPAEVLGVELKYYSNEEVQTLVPRVVGQTVASVNKKTAFQSRQWDEESFLDAIEAQKSEAARHVARKLLEVLKKRDLRIWYGAGKVSGSFIPCYDTGRVTHQMYAVYTYGKVEIYFQYHKMKAPFNDKELRLELMHRLNELGCQLPEMKIDARPSFDIELLSDEGKFDEFVGIFDWFLEKVREFPG